MFHVRIPHPGPQPVMGLIVAHPAAVGVVLEGRLRLGIWCERKAC